MKITQTILLSTYSTECPEVLGTRLCVKCDHIQHLYSKSVLARPEKRKRTKKKKKEKYLDL